MQLFLIFGSYGTETAWLAGQARHASAWSASGNHKFRCRIGSECGLADHLPAAQ